MQPVERFSGLVPVTEEIGYPHTVTDDIAAKGGQACHFFIDKGNMPIEDLDEFRGNCMKVLFINVEDV